MRRIVIVWSLALFCASGCGDKPAPAVPSRPAADVLGPRYEATLAEGIDFRKPGYPRGVTEVRGVGGYEPWGRWTDSAETRITFSEPLPKSFTLEITGGAVGPNAGKPVDVTIGSQTKSFTFSVDPFKGQPETQSLEFSGAGPASTIVLRTPSLWRPAAGDPRELGIALVTLRIVGK
jgi:phosphoglycerol transferase